MKSKILAGLLLLVFSTAHAEEIARIYPDGTGDGMGNIVTARASSVTGIDMLGKIQTYGTNEPSYNQGNLQSLPVAGWTNVTTYSYDFNNGTLNNITLQTGVSGPDGTNNASKIVENTLDGYHRYYKEDTVTTATIYTASIFAKAGERNWLFLRNDAVSQFHGAYYNLTNGTVGNVDAGYTARIEGPFYNGFYRCSVTTTTTSTTWYASPHTASGDGTNSYAGDITKGLYIFGLQIVQGTAPLPYTPTNGAAVSVAGQTLTADISTNTALRDALSDAIGGATSVFTMLTKITPRVDLANISGDPAVLTPGLSIDSTTGDFAVLDGTNTALANDADADPVAGTERWIKVTGDSEADGGAGELQICDSTDSGVAWTCGIKVAYDGALSFANDFTIAGTIDFGGAQFYNTILTDAEATAALSCNQKVLRLLH